MLVKYEFLKILRKIYVNRDGGQSGFDRIPFRVAHDTVPDLQSGRRDKRGKGDRV